MLRGLLFNVAPVSENPNHPHQLQIAPESPRRRGIALIDGMNLFNNAKRAFGYHYPNYDILKLANLVCDRLQCHLVETRFYSGVPRLNVDPDRSQFWASKTEMMRQGGVIVYTRPVRRSQPPQEKGIDLRIGLDAMELTLQQKYDDLILFSTDQDFTEIKPKVQQIVRDQGREVRLISAYPYRSGTGIRVINGFKRHRITREDYDQCIDTRDYRQRRNRT